MRPRRIPVVVPTAWLALAGAPAPSAPPEIPPSPAGTAGLQRIAPSL